MTINWTTTDQASQEHGVKVLLYSQSGIGKTMLCATAPRPLILSAEGGLLSLQKKNIERVFGVNTPGISYDIPVMKITTVKDLDDAYEWITESADASYFDTICIDSLTEIAEQVLANAKQHNADGRKAYGEMAEHMIEVVKNFRDIPKNVYMAAKIDQAKDEVSGMMLYGPSMPGKQTGPQLPYLFDEVFRMSVGKEKDGKEFRYLQTQPDLQSTAKDRSGMLAPFESPNLAYIFDKIRSK